MAEPREIRSPFSFIGPGAPDDDENLYDFSPRPIGVPEAETPEGDEGDPKDSSAQESADSSDLATSAPTGKTVRQPSKEKTAPGLEDAEKGSTQPKEPANS